MNRLYDNLSSQEAVDLNNWAINMLHNNLGFSLGYSLTSIVKILLFFLLKLLILW